MLPVITLACAGTSFTATAKVLTVPFPQIFEGVIVISPLAAPAVSVIEFVVLVPDQPAGFVQA